MKTFKEFLLMESPISNGKPKWDGETDLAKREIRGNVMVNISGESLTEFPFDYSSFEIEGDFNCRDNKLTSLEGSPKKVKDRFDCRTNLLTNLVGSPEEVEDFICSGNEHLVSLKGLSKTITGDLYMRRCPNLFEVSPLLNSKIEDEIFFKSNSADEIGQKVEDILNKYKNNPKNLIKMLAELKQIDKRFC